jgi:hypothetical protein
MMVKRLVLHVGLFLGSAPLSNTGANKFDLTIRGMYGGENTIWHSADISMRSVSSIVRTRDEICNNMNVEVRDAPGLEAVFGGWQYQVRISSTYRGAVDQGPEEIIGILPGPRGAAPAVQQHPQS